MVSAVEKVYRMLEIYFEGDEPKVSEVYSVGNDIVMLYDKFRNFSSGDVLELNRKILERWSNEDRVCEKEK